MPTVRLPKPYTPDELRRLYAAADELGRPDVRAAMTLLHETGLRIAEACAISTEEASGWPEPPWWCRRSICRRHAATLRVIGKGDRERVIVLTPAALRAAHTLRRQAKNGTVVGWSDRGVRYLFAQVGEAAGVHCHPHRFRHQHATELVEAGVPIDVVADMLGHSRMEITRLYVLTSNRAKVAALSRRRRWLRRR